jgi:hypothetical protein
MGLVAAGWSRLAVHCWLLTAGYPLLLAARRPSRRGGRPDGGRVLCASPAAVPLTCGIHRP